MLALFEGRWEIGEIAIAVVLIAGIIALAYIGVTQLGIKIPDWFKKVCWVLLVVVVIVVAIRFVMTL